MAEETLTSEPAKGANRRNIGKKKKGSKGKKDPKMLERVGGKVKIDRRMKKLFRKRAREYNSDDDSGGDDESLPVIREENTISMGSNKEMESGDFSEEEGEDGSDNEIDNQISEDDEDGGIQPGITKLSEGCRAFKMAFRSIIEKNVSDETLGPVLSAHKKLVAEKLAEEEAERKVKGEAKKEKQLVGEKGHVKPATYLDSHEKFLIGVATKGVVKLFNAVNKAQNAQKGLDPSRSKDAKALKKRRKEAFFSELGKTSSQRTNKPATLQTPGGFADGEGPGWAPLRDNYMLTNSKLKNWDKMPDTTLTDDIERMSEDSSSDDD